MIRLNKREEEIMNVLWRLKKAFPKEIIGALDEPVPPYNTVLSMVRKLEKGGFVGHEKQGKSHQYHPLITKRAYQKSILTHLMKDYFGGSPERLLSFFIKEEQLSDNEIDEILTKYKKDEE